MKRQSIHTKHWTLPVFVAIVFLHSACTVIPRHGVVPLKNMGIAELHYIESEKLQQKMHTLEQVVYDQRLNALQVDDEKRRLALRISQQVVRMSRDIQELVGEKGDVVISDVHRSTFIGIADQLGRHGEEIRMLADNYRIIELAPAFNRMIDTCNACHDRFRDM